VAGRSVVVELQVRRLVCPSTDPTVITYVVGWLPNPRRR
jgi:hypothetical protein